MDAGDRVEDAQVGGAAVALALGGGAGLGRHLEAEQMPAAQGRGQLGRRARLALPGELRAPGAGRGRLPDPVEVDARAEHPGDGPLDVRAQRTRRGVHVQNSTCRHLDLRAERTSCELADDRGRAATLMARLPCGGARSVTYRRSRCRRTSGIHPAGRLYGCEPLHEPGGNPCALSWVEDHDGAERGDGPGMRKRRHVSRAVFAAVTAAVLGVAGCDAVGGDSPGPAGAGERSARPTPTPAWDRSPDSIAAVGDSITTGFDACAVLSDCPEASWATGTSARVDSLAVRLLGRAKAAERSGRPSGAGTTP